MVEHVVHRAQTVDHQDISEDNTANLHEEWGVGQWNMSECTSRCMDSSVFVSFTVSAIVTNTNKESIEAKDKEHISQWLYEFPYNFQGSNIFIVLIPIKYPLLLLRCYETGSLRGDPIGTLLFDRCRTPTAACHYVQYSTRVPVRIVNEAPLKCTAIFEFSSPFFS
jgi:hypothetical protein